MAFEQGARPTGSGPGPHEVGEPLAADADLASRWVGGSVLAASDESFGDKENLLNPNAAAFEPGHYGNRGEIVDGWETKRRREPGHDWALIRLGTPGVVTSVDVDTSFFTGNFPEQCVVEACGCEGYPSPAELNDVATDWVEIVHESPLRGDTHNIFPVSDPRRFTHVRLSAFPDGGIARLRVLGQVVPDPQCFDRLTIDLASQEFGGAVVLSSDGFYTSAQMLNRPDQARTMGEGWETRRRRDSGHDFVEFRLAFPGELRQLIIDTAHFKYNASAEVAVHGCGDEPRPPAGLPEWRPLLARTRLQPDTRHVFNVTDDLPVASVRLDAFPDGGLSRFRAIGTIGREARRQAGYRWFNSLPLAQAVLCLRRAGVDEDIAASVAEQRPLTGHWLEGLRERVAAGAPMSGEKTCLDRLTEMLEGPAGVGSEAPKGT
jgi:allantoicase